MKPVINKITIKESLTKKQLDRINRLIVANGCVAKACTYADIHFNTYKKALTGTAIKKEQIAGLMEFCDLIQEQLKTAA